MFEYPNVLFLIFLTPLFFLIILFSHLNLRKKINLIAGKNIETVIPYYSEGQKWLKIILYTLGFFLSIIALARPRWGVEEVEAKVKGRDVYFVIDVSNSMAVQDVVPNRLDVVKTNIKELMKSEITDRFGLIVFTDEPLILCPLTHDYAAIDYFIDYIYPGMYGEGGTNIEDAINVTVDLLQKEVTGEKVILLITDGEELQGNLNNAIRKAKDQDVRVFTIGVGTETGKLIPIKNENNEIVDYIKDEMGKPVRSRLNVDKLKKIAKETDAEFLGIINEKDFLTKAFANINIKMRDYNSLKSKQKVDRYDLFLLPALILFVLGFILDHGKIIYFKNFKLNWFHEKKTLLVFILIFQLFLPFYLISDTTNDISEKKKILGSINGGFWGNKSFNKGNYTKALQQYKSALGRLKGELEARLYYNIGNVYNILGDTKNALKNYENSVALSKDDNLLAKAFYNQGIALFKEKDYKSAMELFKKSLKYNDKDDDARYNYAVCKLLLEEEDKSKEKEEKKDNKSKNEKNIRESETLTKEEIENILKALEQKESQESQKNQRRNLRMRYW